MLTTILPVLTTVVIVVILIVVTVMLANRRQQADTPLTYEAIKRQAKEDIQQWKKGRKTPDSSITNKWENVFEVLFALQTLMKQTNIRFRAAMVRPRLDIVTSVATDSNNSASAKALNAQANNMATLLVADLKAVWMPYSHAFSDRLQEGQAHLPERLKQPNIDGKSFSDIFFEDSKNEDAQPSEATI